MKSAAASRLAPVPAVAWAKAIACQLIVWHHLVLYGALSGGLDDALPLPVHWASEYALMAVQVFLVVGGFLAARSLWPVPARPRLALGEWPALALKRVRRLGPPYWSALAVAVAAAWLARQLLVDPDTPAAPELWQLLAHAGFVQDLVGVPALSTGLWYVAVDLQLFLVLAGLAATAGALARGQERLAAGLALGLAAGLCAASLLHFNLDPDLDTWALYYFGAYGLGVLAQWAGALQRRRLGAWLIAGLGGLALLLAWRGRIALAAATALLLLLAPAQLPVPRVVQWLARVSYGVFLLHYPVSLAVSALLMSRWPAQPAVQASGLLLTWALSLLGGWAMWALFERQSKQS